MGGMDAGSAPGAVWPITGAMDREIRRRHRRRRPEFGFPGLANRPGTTGAGASAHAGLDIGLFTDCSDAGLAAPFRAAVAPGFLAAACGRGVFRRGAGGIVVGNAARRYFG